VGDVNLRDRVDAFRRAAAASGTKVSLHAADPKLAASVAAAVAAAATFLFTPAHAHDMGNGRTAPQASPANAVSTTQYCYRGSSIFTHDHKVFQEHDERGWVAICSSVSPFESFAASRAGALEASVPAREAHPAIATPQERTGDAINKIKTTLRRKDLARTPEAAAVLPHLVTQDCSFSLEDPQIVFSKHCTDLASKFPIEAFQAVAAAGNAVTLGQYREVWVVLGENDSVDPLDQFNAFSFRFYRNKNSEAQEVMLLLRPLVNRLLELPKEVREAALIFIMEHERGHLGAGDEYPEGPRTPEVVKVLIDLETNADFRAFAAMSSQGFDVPTQRAAVQAVLAMTPDSVEREIVDARLAQLELWLHQHAEDVEEVARNAQRSSQMMAAH
jgi:hypothetical protein